MTLGVATHALRAAFGQITPSAAMSLTFDLTAAGNVEPRYFADMTTATNAAASMALFVSGGGNTEFDMSGLSGLDSRNYVSAWTCRPGTTMNTGFPTTSFFAGPSQLVIFGEAGNGSANDSRGIGFATNNNSPLIVAGREVHTITTDELDLMRDREITMMVAGSNTTATFAGWNPLNTDTNGHGWPQRLTVVDSNTQAVILQQDRYNFNPALLDLSNTIDFGFEAGTYYMNPFFWADNAILTGNRQDIQFTSYVLCVGTTTDPATGVNQVSGRGADVANAFGDVFWSYVFDEAGSNVTNTGGNVYAFDQTIDYAARAPANVTARLSASAFSTDPPGNLVTWQSY
jgi:hypothetical protein